MPDIDIKGFVDRYNRPATDPYSKALEKHSEYLKALRKESLLTPTQALGNYVAAVHDLVLHIRQEK